MRRDGVVLMMVFVLGMLVGGALTGTVLGTWIWSKEQMARRDVEAARQETLRALERAEQELQIAREREAALKAQEVRLAKPQDDLQKP